VTTPIRVLIIEDSEDDAQLELRQLRLGGYDAQWTRVDSPDGLLAILTEQPWDVILCDYTMPLFDAPRALKILQDSGLDIPFIIVSGKIGEETAVAAMKAGAHDYVMKDRLNRLPLAVERELREARLRHDRKQNEDLLRRHANNLEFIYALSNELNSLSIRDSIEACVAKIVRQHTAASIVLVSRYLREQQVLETQHVETDSKVVQAISSIIKASPVGFRTTLDQATYNRILNIPVEVLSDANEASLGAIPKGIAELLSKVLGLGKFICLSMVNHGELWGTVVAIMPEGATLPAPKALEAVARISAQALERRATDERYQIIFEKSSVGKAVVSCDGRFLHVNDAFETMIGISRDELEGRLFSEFTHPDDQAKSQAAVGALLAGAATQRFEKRYLRRDGSVIWADVNTSAVRDALGKVLYFITSFIDITEQKRNQEALVSSEALTRGILENVQDAYIRVDREGRILMVSPSAVDIYGYGSVEEMIGLPTLALYSTEEDRNTVISELGRHGSIRDRIGQGKKKDGSLFWVSLNARFFEEERGQMAGAECFVRDITERMQAEKALAESELQFRSLVENLQVGVVAHAPDTTILLSNAKASELLGLTADQMAGKAAIDPAWRFIDEAGETMPIDRYPVNQALASDEPVTNLILGVRRPDRETTTWVQCDAYKIRKPDGQRRLVMVSFFDITERRQAEEVRSKLEEQLQASQKMEAIGILAGGVAHDFNNLLSVILSYTGFVLDSLPDDDSRKTDLLEVEKASERAVALTRQLLAFSRRQVMQPVPLDLNQVARGMEKMLRRILGEDIRFVQVLAPDLGPTMADPGQIEQVLMNLAVNARDAMPRGGQLTIKTSNVEIDDALAAGFVDLTRGSFVEIAVTDTGCGMDDETRERIFEPFFTTKEKGRGTGLGLSTVYGIVKQSGGEIRVESEPGQGSTFRVLMPRLSEDWVSMPVKPAPAPKRVSGGSETILVVEDEEGLRNVALRVLRETGYTVLAAAGGKEAMHLCELHGGEIGLILTDVIMPEMSGKELADQLALTRPGIKVLFMSGYTHDTIVHHGVIDPAVHFLGKPFTAAALRQKVREVLDLESTT